MLVESSSTRVNEIVQIISDAEKLFPRIRHHIKYFASLGSRITGQNGCDEAGEYIYSKFVEYGLYDVQYQAFPIATPVEHQVKFKLLEYPDENFTVYTIEPNTIFPSSTPGIVAPLVYLGSQRPGDPSTPSVDGRIVVMNFDTWDNWLIAASLGAKAVIFIESSFINWHEITLKSDASFNFPRFYMSKQEGERLKRILETAGKPIHGYITSYVTWEKRVGRNVIGFLEGTSQRDKIIVLSAFYDSYSPVINLAPGANDACGIALLLELANYLSQNRPAYSIIFVAYAGHYEGMLGGRWFIEDFFFGNHSEIGGKIIMQIHLQISSYTDVMVLTNTGGETLPSPNMWTIGSLYMPYKDYVIKRINELNEATDERFTLIDGLNWGQGGPSQCPGLQKFFPDGALPNEGELFAFRLYHAGFTFITPTNFKYAPSPLDTYESINEKNLEKQVKALFYVIYKTVTEEDLHTKYLQNFVPKKAGYWVKGRVAVYDESTDWYDGLGGSFVYFKRLDTNILGQVQGWRNFVIPTDDDGYFAVPQLETLGWATSYYQLIPFKLDDKTGNILYGPDYGSHKFGTLIPSAGATMGDHDLGFVTVFKCASIVLFDIVDPRRLVNYNTAITYSILDVDTLTTSEYYGYIDNLLLVKPDQPVVVLIKSVQLGKVPLGVLTNGSSSNPLGSGYKLKAGEQLIISNTPLQIAKDFYYLSKSDVEILEQYQLQENLPKRLEDVYDLINIALASENDSEIRALSMSAWSKILNAYIDIRNVLFDAATTSTYYILFLLPFTFLLQLMMFPSLTGIKRILALVSIFGLSFAIFSLLHPGFQVVSNAGMITLGFVIVILITVPILIIFSNFINFFKILAFKMLGPRYAEVSKVTSILRAYSIGVRNINKRKARSSLTFISIILITMSLASFMSLKSILYVRPERFELVPPYNGIYVGLHEFGTTEWPNLGHLVISQLRYIFGEQVSPRNWLFTKFKENEMRYSMFTMQYENKSYKFYALMGLTSRELKEYATSFIGSPFWPSKWSCMIPDSAADALGIKAENLPVTIIMLGREWIVTGIINSTIFDSLIDISGESIAPRDFSVNPMYGVSFVKSSDLVLIPYESSLHYSDYIPLVSVIVTDASNLHNKTEIFYKDFGEMFIYEGLGNNTFYYCKTNIVTVFGWQIQVVPVVLGSLIITNVMLAAVYERKRDIFVYSSVGLSPLDVGVMFISEAAIYGIVSGVIGFNASLILIKLSSVIGFSIPANFSSIWVLISILFAIIASIAPSVYPAYIASRLVTPSLERVWKIPTKPTEDEWDIPFPFHIEDWEISGLMIHYLRLFQAHRHEAAEIFNVRDINISEGTHKKILNADVRLAPYESGVSQRVMLIFEEDLKTKRWNLNVHLYRRSGSISSWELQNHKFLDVLRKHFLAWKALRTEEKEKFISKLSKLSNEKNGVE